MSKSINNLFIKAELFVNGQKHVFEKKVISSKSPLGPYEVIQYEDMVLSKDVVFNDLKQNNDIFVRYFAKKCEDAPWILIKIDFLNIYLFHHENILG